MTPPEPSRLFVYGTLMPGRLRWSVLAPFATEWRPAGAPGAIYDSGQGWPVAVFDGGSGALVPGAVVELDPARLDEALVVIDDVEDTATDLLRRIAVVTNDGLPAWAYHFPHSPAGLDRIERWHDQSDR